MLALWPPRLIAAPAGAGRAGAEHELRAHATRLAGRRAAASALEPQQNADSGDGYGKAGGRWTVVRARADRICDFVSSLSGPAAVFAANCTLQRRRL